MRKQNCTGIKKCKTLLRTGALIAWVSEVALTAVIRLELRNSEHGLEKCFQ
jgi:hypothetical protein